MVHFCHYSANCVRLNGTRLSYGALLLLLLVIEPFPACSSVKTTQSRGVTQFEVNYNAIYFVCFFSEKGVRCRAEAIVTKLASIPLAVDDFGERRSNESVHGGSRI